MAERIQVFKPLYRTEEIIGEIRECLENSWTGLGYKTTIFEDKWKEYTNLPHAHFLNSATAGLHAAIAILKQNENWNDGDEIISSSLTFVSTNHAILYEKMTPIFADVDDYGCLDPSSIETLITPKTRAVIFVGLGGNTGQLPKVAALCRKNKIKLILDAAHMAGAKLNNADPAHLADVTVFSFQAVKNLPTADSGMICFLDENLDKQARQFTWLGIDKDTFLRFQNGAYNWHYDVPKIGYKYHGNSIMASLGIVGLKYLDIDNERRREISEFYEISFQNDERIHITPTPKGLLHPRHVFQIRVSEREKIIELLNNKNIFPGVHYASNERYQPYSKVSGENENAKVFSDSVISLPIHLHLSDQDIQHIADLTKKTIDSVSA